MIANVCIILVSVLLVGVLVKYLFFTSSPERTNRASRNSIQRGQNVSMPQVDWRKNGKTLVLVLQKDCRFCTESADFYKQLVAKTAHQQNSHLMAVFPQPVDEARMYLSNLGVSIDDVRQESLASFPITGTPTLILVNDAGVATEIWIGKLKPEGEAEVLNKL